MEAILPVSVIMILFIVLIIIIILVMVIIIIILSNNDNNKVNTMVAFYNYEFSRFYGIDGEDCDTCL